MLSHFWQGGTASCGAVKRPMLLPISQSEKAHRRLRSAWPLPFIARSEYLSLRARNHGTIFRYSVCFVDVCAPVK